VARCSPHLTEKGGKTNKGRGSSGVKTGLITGFISWAVSGPGEAETVFFTANKKSDYGGAPKKAFFYYIVFTFPFVPFFPSWGCLRREIAPVVLFNDSLRKR